MERISNTAVLERPSAEVKIAVPTYQELAKKTDLAYEAYLKSHRTVPGGDLGLELAYIHDIEVLLHRYPVRKHIGLPIPRYRY